jgi:hypothetical protein
MKLLSRIKHRLAHAIGWNLGRVETWWEGEELMVGFRCECGDLSGVHCGRTIRDV